jgi:hypothetical protein
MKYLTKDEIIEKEYARLTEEDFRAINALTSSNTLHMGYGLWIRDDYNLWDAAHPATNKWFRDCAEAHRDGIDGKHAYMIDGTDYHPNHPDNVSAEIIECIIAKAKARHVKA